MLYNTENVTFNRMKQSVRSEPSASVKYDIHYSYRFFLQKLHVCLDFTNGTICMYNSFGSCTHIMICDHLQSLFFANFPLLDAKKSNECGKIEATKKRV